MADFDDRETPSRPTSIDGTEPGGDDDTPAHRAETAPPGNHSEDANADDDHHHAHDHDHHAHDLKTIRAAVVTVSSTRSLDDDPSGDAIVAALETDGHEITTRELVVDDLDGVQGRVAALVERDDVDVVVTTGGTGVTPDDVTVEAVRPLFDKRLPGFGELFRRRSESEIGTRVVGTRAIAGISDGVPVFCLPGSEPAAELGATEIIVPEAGHLAGLARREEDEEE